MAGISGKGSMRPQQRRRLGDEEYILVAWRGLHQPPRQPWSDEETWRLAQLKCLNEACNGLLMLGMWCTVLHWTVLHCPVQYC